MAQHEDPDAFDAGYWEGRYRAGQGADLHGPSPSLVTEASGLRPGRALDAGCGTGGDALWLADRGWQVTAADVSGTAVARGRANALALGSALAERIEWVHADLTSWEPSRQGFDLVSSHYVHVPGSMQPLVRRLASWVEPGGRLLVVGHDGAGHGAGHGAAEHGSGGAEHPAGAQVLTEQVVAALPAGQWDVLVAESRTHPARAPGASSTRDVVVHARRRVQTPD